MNELTKEELALYHKAKRWKRWEANPNAPLIFWKYVLRCRSKNLENPTGYLNVCVYRGLARKTKDLAKEPVLCDWLDDEVESPTPDLETRIDIKSMWDRLNPLEKKTLLSRVVDSDARELTGLSRHGRYNRWVEAKKKWEDPEYRSPTRFKLSEAQVADIRELAGRGVKQTAIARRYDISRSLVCRILKGERRALPNSDQMLG